MVVSEREMLSVRAQEGYYEESKRQEGAENSMPKEKAKGQKRSQKNEGRGKSSKGAGTCPGDSRYVGGDLPNSGCG